MASRTLPRPSAADLLAWYDRHRRHLPWRAPPDAAADPYAVWLSEIMLQQTTVAAVKPYFERFMARWPTVQALAAAAPDEVMAAWAGLGYYARARNLLACAQVVTRDFGGVFPDTETALRALPGIGPYTAAAIAAIAFGRRAVVVDGNVERVMARLHAVTAPLPAAKARLRALAEALTPDERPGDYAQAVMDLGATVCTPKSPACARCPWAAACRGRARGIAATLPRKAAKKAAPTRHGVAFWVTDARGRVLLQRRPPRGLLGGMLGFPGTAWREAPWTAADARRAAPVTAAWTPLPGEVEHTFTHFRLKLRVWAGRAPRIEKTAEALWLAPGTLESAGLPNVMRKVAHHAQTSLRRSKPARPRA